MGWNQQNFEKEVAKERMEQMAELMLMSEKNIPKDCPLRKILEKTFIERVLWLEDQTKHSLDVIITQCRNCGKCNFKNAPKKM
jgi:hypothetical protein